MVNEIPSPPRQLALRPIQSQQSQQRSPDKSKVSSSFKIARGDHTETVTSKSNSSNRQGFRVSSASGPHLKATTSSHYESKDECIAGLVLSECDPRSRKAFFSGSTCGNDRKTINARNDRSLSSSRSVDLFQENMSTLPSEICTIIMDMTLALIFGPGNVHPKADSSLPSVKEVFLALDRQLYREYREVYWSRNTWVVGKGPATESMRFMTVSPFFASAAEFSKQRPNEAALNIRRIELCFSTEDLRRPPKVRLEQIEASRLISGSETAKEDETSDKRSESDLLQIWQDKFDRIAFLKLDYLNLDFKKAYALDGAFLGVSAAQRLMPFLYGIPIECKITAPSKALESEIRSAFLEINRPTPSQT